MTIEVAFLVFFGGMIAGFYGTLFANNSGGE